MSARLCGTSAEESFIKRPPIFNPAWKTLMKEDSLSGGRVTKGIFVQGQVGKKEVGKHYTFLFRCLIRDNIL